MSIKSYILEDEFKITVLNNRVNVLNYIDIISFSDSNITVKGKQCSVSIKGSSLVIKKLVKDEMLIIGNISSIEFR